MIQVQVEVRWNSGIMYSAFKFSIIVFNASYIVAVSFIGGGNWSGWRKPLTCTSHWQTLSHNVVSSTPCLNRIRMHSISGDGHWLNRCNVVVNPITIWSRPRRPPKMRVDCSFCWYWSSCWPSLFQLAFHDAILLIGKIGILSL